MAVIWCMRCVCVGLWHPGIVLPRVQYLVFVRGQRVVHCGVSCSVLCTWHRPGQPRHMCHSGTGRGARMSVLLSAAVQWVRCSLEGIT